MLDPKTEDYDLCVYYVRGHLMKDQLIVCAMFDDNSELQFEERRLPLNSNDAPSIYTLKLAGELNDNEQLTVHGPNNRINADHYYLEILHKTLIATSYREKLDDANQKHSLSDQYKDRHHFLFGINFSGNNIPGTSLDRFTEFCFFTCIILEDKLYDVFDILAKQFDDFVLKHTVSNDTFTDQSFFLKVSEYFIDIFQRSDDKLNVVKIILQFIGHLPKNIANVMAKDSSYIGPFANKMMSYVRKNINQFLNQYKQTYLISGLVLLLCSDLFEHKSNENESEGKLSVFVSISDKKLRQELATELLEKLFELKQQISDSINWTDLFLIADPMKIVINHFELTNSFRTFNLGITKLARTISDGKMFQSTINEFLEKQINMDQLRVDIDSILYLMEFLKQTEENASKLTLELLNTVQLTIDSSTILQLKISQYFDKLQMNSKNMKKIASILCSIDRFKMLRMVNKCKYLEKSLSTLTTTSDIIQWFQLFLAQNEISNDNKQLMNCWMKYFKNNKIKLRDILQAIDQLFEPFNSSNDDGQFRSFCIDCLIDFCFESTFFQLNSIDFIYDLRNTQNQFFCKQFKHRFSQKYITNEQLKQIREMNDDSNLLQKLIAINKKTTNQSQLIRDLIESICNEIQINDKNELLSETFFNPSDKSLSYLVLFDQIFQSLPIRQRIQKHLTDLWNEWKNGDFQLNEIEKWKTLKEHRRTIACRIWNLISKENENQVRFEDVIDEADRKIQKIFQIKLNVSTCIDYYCKNACDRNRYLSLLNDLQRELDQKTISSTKIPNDIKTLQPYAENFNQMYSSTVWKSFYKLHFETKNFGCSSFENKQNQTCLDILKEFTDIRQKFIDRLKNLCTNTNEPLHPQLEQLFPEKNRIDQEFDILKCLLDESIASTLRGLLDYWKNRERIVDILTGCQHIMDNYKLPLSNKLSILQNILRLDDHTSNENCIAVYRDYCIQFSQFSNDTIELIYQWCKAHDLLKYFYELETTNVDDLLEIVNDYDDSLVNTKTVLDFVLLKRFLDKVNVNISDVKKTNKSIEFDDVIRASEEILKQGDFKNLLKNFEGCRKNLSSIQQILSNATDREFSKRKRILDITTKSELHFNAHHMKEIINTTEYKFDVNIINNDWRLGSFDDLSDLRDRARLIKFASSNSNNVQNYTGTDIQKLKLFISLVDTVENILQKLTELYIAGYPVKEQYFSSERKFPCKEGNYDELKNYKEELNKQLTDWERELCDKYKECVNLTYFSYQQLSMIENGLRNETALKPSNAIYHLLKFVGVDPQSIEAKLLPGKSNRPFELLRIVSKIVQTRQEHKDEQIQTKISVIETRNQGILHAILSLFHLNNISPPIANQLFYCTRYTNWIEVRAFIYRCFYSQTLHQLIQPELLSIVIQDQFGQLLTQLMDKSPNQIFRLGIITTTSSIHLPLVHGFRSSRIIQILRDQDLLNEIDFASSIKESIRDHCILVTSIWPGLGKSTYIENQIRKTGKTHIKFPISGDVNIDTLLERLRDEKIQCASSSIAIHITIGQVENIQQLNEFLYSLLIFRCFRFGQMPVNIARDIPVYIELDSSMYLSNLREQITILKYMETKNIEQLDLNELDISLTKVKWVINYLQAIDDRKIDDDDIQEESIIVPDRSISIYLLEKYFLSKANSKSMSWTRLFILLSIYYKLFYDFSNCGYFIVNTASASSLRCDILNSLLDSFNQFTSLSVETVRERQRNITDKENETSLNNAIIQWNKLQAFTLIFTSDNAPLFVYKSKTDIPLSVLNALRLDYRLKANQTVQTTSNKTKQSSSFFPWRSKSSTRENSASRNIEEIQLDEFLIDPNEMTHEQFFLRLTSLSKKYILQKSLCLNCFNQFDYTEEKCTLCEIATDLVRPKSSGGNKTEDFQKLIAQNILSTYVFTADNYVKMLLIYLRVQSNLPVLIMGETGCGKTALIQCLCQKILDDYMEVFHIHAGITNEKIIEQMHKYIQQAETYLKEKSKKRLWIFFDEFNTTPNIDLIKEIVCERTLFGEKLPVNMVFLGACNPQRQKVKKDESTELAGIKKYHANLLHKIAGTQSSLLYSVVPIPETMLEHIWDYGFLDEATEMKYIEKILDKCQNLKSDSNWFTATVEMISKSQEYFRKNDDVSSVSLRDAVRFCRFYNWFFIKFPMLSNSNLFTPIERASLLALLLCYYFRLNSSKERKKYADIITKLVKERKPNISNDSIYQLLSNERMNLIDRMDLPRGTAKNGALTDNIFVLFTCILNKIPAILCGEPGSSKTSAVQIIISNLKGKKSQDEFFRNQPELVSVSFQGSQNCISESIIKVFERADKYANAKSDIQLLPVIVFDEIGLAEISPHNPLKVLHSQLEMESCRHGFVGLSNWRLDASKMNRVVYLSCPEPELDDLKCTAVCLSESMLTEDGQRVSLDQHIVEGLAVAYMKLCEHMKKPGNQQYFGLRDYYSLIKGVMHDTIQKGSNNEEDLYQIIRKQFACNFDHPNLGSELIWSKFFERSNKVYRNSQYLSPTFDQLLNQCLSSRNGRFLMLISDSENTFDYLQQYITSIYPSMQMRTLIGSTFPSDFLSKTTYTEQYNVRVLMDIILDAERNVTLFLRGLRHLYDNLYDLFNQSFAVSAKKKYCRIALGSLYHPRCIIHDEFYCVVFLKEQDLDKYDLPFLNRFEKHFIQIDTLIADHHKTIASELDQWITQLLSTKSNTDFPSRKHLFPEYSNNYSLNLVTNAFNHLTKSENSIKDPNVLNYCQNELIRISSFDLPLLLSLESNIDQNQQLIQQYYQIHKHLSFTSFINEEFLQKQNNKLLIYTYTQISHPINDNEMIKEINLSYIKTELELIEKIKNHYKQTESSRCLLCIRIDYYRNYQHVPILKHILMNEYVNDINRGICLIFHLQRCQQNQINNEVFFDGWSRVMIDDLQTHELLPEKILLNPCYDDLINHLKFLNIENVFDDLINHCIIQLTYVVTNENHKDKINDRRNRIIEQLTFTKYDNENNKSLRSLVKICLTQWIKKIVRDSNQTQFIDWRDDLLSNGIINNSSRSIKDALNTIISLFLDKYLSLLFRYLEKHSLIDSYLFLVDSEKELRQKFHPLWQTFWNMTVENIDLSVINENYTEIPLVLDIHLPCAAKEYEIICQIRQIVAQQRQNDDINLTDNAYNQLIARSFYGSSIDEIFQDPNMFNHYYHDQLILTQNEAHIYQLPTVLIQQLASTLYTDVKYQLTYLLVYPEELFEIMRLFEIGLSLIDEKLLVKIIDQQFTFSSLNNNSNFYSLVQQEDRLYLIPPKSSVNIADTYEGIADPFMETSLMNLIELLVSQVVLSSVNDIHKLMIVYNFFSQSVNKLLRYERHSLNNLEKFHSFRRLTSCITALFEGEKAMSILKIIHQYSNGCPTFHKLDSIHDFVLYLRQVIEQNDYTIEGTIAEQILLKFENELVRNWSIENRDKCNDILNFIYKNNLWKYSSKILSFVDNYFQLSITTMETAGCIRQNENDEENIINLLSLPNDDSSKKIEILMATRIYSQLILNSDYQSAIVYEKIGTILKDNLENFQQNLVELHENQNNHTMNIISSVAWLKYYLLYYVYALKNDINDDEIMGDIDRIFLQQNLPICSTLKLYVIKLLCFTEQLGLPRLHRKYENRNVTWIHRMIDEGIFVHNSPFNARYDIMLPTPLFEFLDDFKQIDETLLPSISIPQMKDFIRECSKSQSKTYCFIMWFVHYYTRYSMNTIVANETFAIQLVISQVKQDLDTYFGIPGQKLIHGLVTNFADESYFQLNVSMSEQDLHQRLLVLNIIAALLSFKSTEVPSFFSLLLFEQRFQVSNDYIDGSALIHNLRLIANLLSTSQTTDFINIYIKERKLEDHLNFHFMNFWIQSILVFLCELDCIPNATLAVRKYFQQEIETRYNSLQQYLPGVNQSYLWFYNLVNHMVKDSSVLTADFNSIEQIMQEKFLIPHSQSVIAEIKQYRSTYLSFIYNNDKNNQLISYVNELIGNNDKYPLLNFFNVTNIHAIDVIDHFYKHLQLQPNYKVNYPVTNFILERLSDYDNIQYLHPIIRFINYLMQQFDQRIKRDDANKKTIADCLKTDKQLQPIFDKFLVAWRSINLEEVTFEQKKYNLKTVQSGYNFEDRTSISMFLLNKSNDDKNMIPAACLQTIVAFQNNIFDYFHLNIMKNENNHDHRIIPIQSIHQKNLFDFDTNKLRKLLVDKCLIINYEYGMGEEILYDFDEIEWTLKNEISCLPKIDFENMRYFNYQDELYDENKSLINDIRINFSQKLFDNQKRTEIKNFISLKDNSSITEISNSLEYILTYLRTISNKNIVKTSTIKTFIAKHIRSKAYLGDAFSEQLFSSLSLEYMIDLHELVEEYVFDAVLRHSMKTEFSEKSFSIEQHTLIIRQFNEMISNDKNLAECFRDLNIWIDMFKRLLVRLLLSKIIINYNSSLYQYIKRSDMWKGNIKSDDLRTIEIKESIQLKHAYIILRGLELKLDGKTSMRGQSSLINSEVERRNVRNQNQTNTSTAQKTKKSTSRVVLRD